MSFIIENRPPDELSNKNREHLFSLEMREEYSFKYIPESHFKHIIKNVQRQRRKEDEERVWASFVKEQELNGLRFQSNDIERSVQNVKDMFEDDTKDVDQELQRFQEDMLPEDQKGTQHRTSKAKNEKNNMQVNSTRGKPLTEQLLQWNNGTYASNITVPVTPNNDIPICNQSKGLTTVFRSKAKKSLSDTSITEKKSYTNQLLRATGQFQDNSDTDSNNYKDDVVYIQPDPQTIQKLLSMQKKISELLDEISFRLCRIPLPDGETDLKRRQQQTLEFAIRFSRNYLYNLSRLVTSIQRHIRTVSARAGLKQYNRNIAFHQDMIKQKLIAAHQLLIQALNAYYKHIPNSILKGHSTKLQDVLQIVCNLNDICDKVEISNNYLCSGDTTSTPLGKHLQDKCVTILSKLKNDLENKHVNSCNKAIEPTASIASVPFHNKKHGHKNLSSRLSMYSLDVKVSKGNQKKRNDLRRKSYAWQKESEINVRSVKDQNSQHNSLPELLYPSPITHMSSSRDVVRIDSARSRNSLKDDDIRTMMGEAMVDSENDSNVEIHTKDKTTLKADRLSTAVQRQSSLEMRKCKNTEETLDNINEETSSKEDDLIKKITTIAKEHFTSLAPVINDLVAVVAKKPSDTEDQVTFDPLVETLKEFLQKYHPSKDYDAKIPSADNAQEKAISKSNNLSDRQKWKENVQLICMSSAERISKAAQCDVSCQADYKASSEINGNGCSNAARELVVPKEVEQEFLVFRCEYLSMCESRPMYTSNTHNKPWDIVAWISDKLIEELIVQITEELQMSDVIKKLFEMEFQEY